MKRNPIRVVEIYLVYCYNWIQMLVLISQQRFQGRGAPLDADSVWWIIITRVILRKSS